MGEAERDRGVRPNGQLIRDLRKQKGWEQEELGKKAKVATSTISRAERGKSIDIATLKLIHAVFCDKVSFEDLLIHEGTARVQSSGSEDTAKTITAMLKGDEKVAEKLLTLLFENGVNIEGLLWELVKEDSK